MINSINLSENTSKLLINSEMHVPKYKYKQNHCVGLKLY